jgi:AcrR family transcriptional regulator
MRESNRSKILDAAARVVQREGVRSVTYESVAAEAGLTKGGLVYHFASRDELLLAIHQHLAAEWEAGMVAVAGKPAAEATTAERLAAYTRASTQSSSRAELLFLLEGSTNPEYAAPWNAVTDRWTPPVTELATDAEALTRFIARLAADGLWLYDSLTDEPLDPELRRRVAERIATALL